MICNVLEYLERSTAKHPDKFLFQDDEISVTYAQTCGKARAIGTLLAKEVKKGSPVAVLIDRNVTSLISFLGAAYGGCFYVPIDTQMPKQRIDLILDTLKPQAAIILERDRELLESLEFSGKTVIYEEVLESQAEEEILAKIRGEMIDTDPLYAMFTSGSTGVPKGVLISHRSVIDLVEQFAESFGFKENDIFGNQAPFDFDVSVKDIYSVLRAGATLQVIPRQHFSLPFNLIRYLNEKNITVAIWATSALCIVANLKTFEKEQPKYLRTVMFSGEVMPNKVLNYWRNYLPEVQFVNLYGPTEITCNCTYFKVDRPFEDDEVLPIGIPFKNTEILVLNDKNELVSGDEIGEICVRGTSLALGYYNNPEKTAEVFCQNPLNPYYPERIYRTGDLGRYNELGELMFCSRKDFQIKHMGHRIELGEVEVAVNALPFIEAACCLYDQEHEKIILFYQSQEECKKQILVELKDKLPKYMWPNKQLHFAKLPMNKNAKIDRVKLRQEYIDNKK